MSNRGVSPIDPATPVGQLRLAVADTASVALEPAEVGVVDYANYSDADLEAFLAAASGEPVRATGYAYLQLAAIYSAQGKSIRTDDLAISTLGRGADLIAVAKSYFAQADAADAAGGLDFFDIATPYTRIDVDPFSYGVC